MKLKTTYTALLMGMGCQLSFGAAYLVTNDVGGSTNAILDNAGVPLALATGAAELGFFSGGDTDVSSASDATTLLDSWQQFGTTGTFDDNFFYDFGVFSTEGSGIDAVGNGFVGKNVYLIIGNASALASADEFFVYKFDELFAENEPGTGTNLTLGADPGSLLMGRDLGTPQSTIGGTDSTLDDTWATQGFTPVPEPSSTMLFGLSAFALLLHRRR